MTAENLRIGNIVVVENEFDGSFKVHVVGTNPIISSDRVTFKPVLKKNRTNEFFVSTQNVTISIEDSELAVYDVITTLGEYDSTDYSDELSSSEWDTVEDLLGKAQPKMVWALDNLVDEEGDADETEPGADIDETTDSEPDISDSPAPRIITSRYYINVQHPSDVDIEQVIFEALNRVSINIITELE